MSRELRGNCLGMGNFKNRSISLSSFDYFVRFNDYKRNGFLGLYSPYSFHLSRIYPIFPIASNFSLLFSPSLFLSVSLFRAIKVIRNDPQGAEQQFSPAIRGIPQLRFHDALKQRIHP